MKACIAVRVLGVIILGAGTGIGHSADDGTITITASDFKKSPEKLLKSLEQLESQAAVSNSTADYALNYQNFQDDLSKASPPLPQWNEPDRDRVKNLAQPTDAAWQALRTQQAQVQQQKADAAQQELDEKEARDRARREQNRLQAEQDRLDSEAEARNDLLDELEYDNGYYPYYGGNWWNGNRPIRPIRPDKPDRPNRPPDGPYVKPISDSFKTKPVTTRPAAPSRGGGRR